MRYDFHVHTKRYSPCSLVSAAEVCEQAVQMGLRGIGLTEHDVWWPASDLKELQERFPQLTIFRGSEYAYRDDHFLIFLPEEEDGRIPRCNGILSLIDAVHQRDGIVIWAHPFRFNGDWSDWMTEADLDGLEVWSSNMDQRTRRLAREVAERKGLRVFCNSDTHELDTVGKYYNEIPREFENTREFVRYVREGHTWNI
jgi:predicted metal-dependent phosphoesterase TrpH